MTSPEWAEAEIPGLLRRLACLAYEGVLLFALAVVTGLIFSPLVQQRHALDYRYGLMATVVSVFALYFVYFWSRNGQTLAMQTWHVRVLDLQGKPLTTGRALSRYALSWLWFLPALSGLYLFDMQRSGGAVFCALFAGIIAYALLAQLHPQKQFLHDRICGTRLVTWRQVKSPDI